MQDFIGIRISDAAEQSWIGQSALQRVIFPNQRFTKRLHRRIEHLERSTVENSKVAFLFNQVQRGSFLRSGFREQQGAGLEIERRETQLAGDFRAAFLPLKPSGNHQMNDKKQSALK